MRLANVVHGMLALGWWAAMVTPAFANSLSSPAASPAQVAANVKFDLARDCPRPVNQVPARADGLADQPTDAVPAGQWSGSLIDQFTPNIYYQPLEGGPTLGLAALGSGRKGRPGLAHIALDWSF